MTDLPTAPVSDGRLAYVDAGSGPPIVLLHGGVLDHRMWSRQVDVFAASHRVIAPDARGHGASSTPRAPFRHCDDVAELLRHLDIARAALVGLSMGAGTAVDVAVEYPDLVAALVVTGTGTSDPDWRDPWTFDLLATWARNERDRDAAAWLETFLRLASGPHRTLADIDPQVVAELRQQATDTLSTHVPQGDPVLPEPGRGVRERAPNIAVPALALPGALDSPDHIRMARELADGVADGSTVMIDGAAHYPNLERPDEFNALVLDFLARVGA